MDVKVIGRIRKPLEGIDAASPGDDEQLALTGGLEQLIAHGASPYGEITRLGRAFKVGTAAAIGAVVAIPTTAVMLGLYNNEPDGGRSLVIDWIGAQNVVSTAVAGQAQLLAMVGQVRETAPTDAALPIVKLNGLGGSNGDTKARTILNATALPATTGLAANWIPWGPSVGKSGVAATPGYGLWAPVDGRIIVAPGRYFAVHVLANVVGETFVAFVGWHERQLVLG
jgi:hypothetical protein